MKQFIICPECGSIEFATIEETIPFWSYVHFCTKCDYIIMESEWKPAKAISIRQPWAYLIASGIKYIENRTWKLPEKHKGERVLIHTGAKRAIGHRPLLSDQQRIFYGEWNYRNAILGDTSAIVGSVEIVDCVINHPSIWAEQSKMFLKSDISYKPIYNWILKDPILFEKPVLNVKGKLSFFTPEIPNE